MTARQTLNRLPLWARWLVFFGAAGLILGIGGALGTYLYFAPTVPQFDSIDDYHPKIGTRLYANDGTVIAEFAEERRELLEFSRMPPLLVQAFISAEDKRFYEHGGVDPLGTVKAVVDKLLSPSSKLRGASTITQQVAKSFLASRESYEEATQRSLVRKVREAILARRLEAKLEKREILWLYLNQVFLGHKAYGVQVAAQNYFRKNAWEMSLAEMATLAGLPQRPSDYSPFLHPESAMGRRKYVLGRLLEDGHISAEEREEALAEELRVYPVRERYLQSAPYFAEQVRRELVARYGHKTVVEGGLHVTTTMDVGHQYWGQESVRAGLKALDKRQGYRGALAQIDPDKRQLFIERYREELELEEGAAPEFDSDMEYIALVTGFKDNRTVELNVAGTKGYLPLAAMRWARRPNPVMRYDNHYLTGVRSVLNTGDAIVVRPVSLKDIRSDEHAGEALKFLDGKFMESIKGAQLFALEQEPIAQASMMAADPFTGYVKAQVGGYNFETSSFNRATQACREPGSAFKPIVYSAAIDKLDYTASTLIEDKPMVFDDPENQMRWKPNNAGMEFQGEIPLRKCLMESINTPAIRLAWDVGIDDILQNARNMGIKTPLKEELGTALGSSCTYLSNLMQVYITLNQYGVRRPMTFITKVVDRDGFVLEDRSAPVDPTLALGTRLDRAYAGLIAEPPEVLDRQSAFLTVSLMKNVIQGGTGYKAKRLQIPLAGKTGTTDDSYDAWFMGFSKNMVAGAWVGHDKKERPLGINEQGGKTALPIWLNYMDMATRDHKKPKKPRIDPGDFQPPSGVVMAYVDPNTGYLARDGDEDAVPEWYRSGTQPSAYALEEGVVDAGAQSIFEAE